MGTDGEAEASPPAPRPQLLRSHGLALSALVSLEAGVPGVLGARLVTCSYVGQGRPGVYMRSIEPFYSAGDYLLTRPPQFRCTWTGELAVKDYNCPAGELERVAQELRVRVRRLGVERSKRRVKGSQGHFVTISN